MKKVLSDRLIFYITIIGEFIFLPFLVIREEWKKNRSSSNPLKVKKTRSNVATDTIRVNVHEWGGYQMVRKKRIKENPEFTCGLKFQLERFNHLKKDFDIFLNVTLSEPELHQDLAFIKDHSDHLDFVKNAGMDFSGYSFFYEKIKELPNSYVILTNSSVNKIETDFLKDYIRYMEENLDVGILGVSYSSKKFQTLVRNNFSPHLQSFFLLTTTQVLKEIVEKNKGLFPGSNIAHKLLLIIQGEVKISQIALQLGYNLAVTLENKKICKFGVNSRFDNGYKRWSLRTGDVRLTVKNPNIINEINL